MLLVSACEYVVWELVRQCVRTRLYYTYDVGVCLCVGVCVCVCVRE